MQGDSDADGDELKIMFFNAKDFGYQQNTAAGYSFVYTHTYIRIWILVAQNERHLLPQFIVLVNLKSPLSHSHMQRVEGMCLPGIQGIILGGLAL